MKFIQFALAAIAVLMAAAPSESLADAASREYQVKAAFIYNFVQFVDWPADAFADADSPITIAVVGDDPFKGALEQAVGGKRVKGRRLAYRHFASIASVEPAHVLYVSPSLEGQLGQLLEKMRGASVLTVGDNGGFTMRGGIIRFFTEENKVRFEIRPKAAEPARIQISAKLLKVARIYREG